MCLSQEIKGNCRPLIKGCTLDSSSAEGKKQVMNSMMLYRIYEEEGCIVDGVQVEVPLRANYPACENDEVLRNDYHYFFFFLLT